MYKYASIRAAYVISPFDSFFNEQKLQAAFIIDLLKPRKSKRTRSLRLKVKHEKETLGLCLSNNMKYT